MIIDQILQGITKENEDHEKGSPLRASSSGKCARQLAYQYHGFEAEKLPARSLMVFRLGDIIESEVKDLIKKYCANLNITYPTDTITVTIAGKTITAHVDGLIDDDTVLEVKSINGMRFKMLDREGIPEDYKKQATVYMKGLKRHKTLFLFYCKDTSHLREMIFEYDPEMYEEIKRRFTSVITSTKDNLPNREYEPLKTGALPWQCSYCSFTKICWPDYELTFTKQNKPQWIKKKVKQIALDPDGQDHSEYDGWPGLNEHEDYKD